VYCHGITGLLGGGAISLPFFHHTSSPVLTLRRTASGRCGKSDRRNTVIDNLENAVFKSLMTTCLILLSQSGLFTEGQRATQMQFVNCISTMGLSHFGYGKSAGRKRKFALPKQML
jgi:hypothetical protein